MNRPRLRKYISMREKLAAALAERLPVELRDVLRKEQVSARLVIEQFEFDHAILHALGGSDAWHNLTPRLKAEHREKSRGDTSIVAKVRRVSREHEDFRARMLKPDKGRSEAPRSKWPKRKLQSRNDLRRREDAERDHR